ncbi:MAG: peptidoglycan DD-metalloendopeptidase family protein [Pseudomonadota bacterium]
MGARPPAALSRPRSGFAVGALLLSALLAACQQAPLPAPVSERSPLPRGDALTYRIAPGDTLYSVAFRHQLDYLALARWNALEPPYALLAGRTLRLRPPAPEPDRPAARTRRSEGRDAAPASESQLRWRWPVAAPRARGFGGGSIGIDFTPAAGAPVRAAADGEVVYAGSGLGGYQHLIILRHGSRFLSAYGFNGVLVVAEGDFAKVGARLADIESIGQRRERLHFEIRDRGSPIDPARVIR